MHDFSRNRSKLPEMHRSEKQASSSDELQSEFITLKQAAALVGKTPSNISYLVQYDRLNKYNQLGERVDRASNGELRVSRIELLSYFESLKEWQKQRLKGLSIQETELAFMEVPERERTKHVHRSHPYLGKFIPQLVEYFLSRYFQPCQVVIDPFCGSGTTLVQAAEMGIHSIGIDISEFNVMISKVKLGKYDIDLVGHEVMDAFQRTADYSNKYLKDKDSLSVEDSNKVSIDSSYLKAWFPERSLREMLYYRDLMQNYKHQELLKVLLSRTIRSCRLTYHYELANPKRPVREPYVCHKHKSKICTPVSTIMPRLSFYSRDTVKRLAEFSQLRKQCESVVLEGDSRSIDMEEGVDKRLGNGWLRAHHVRGVFTSPPYVGQIDYHDQHRYAYELFGIKRRDALEIGPKQKGKGNQAQASYVEGISSVLLNVKKSLSVDSLMFIVANDRLSLYPTIFRKAKLEQVQALQRPVEDRTERDKRPYSESVFMVRPQ